MLTKEKKCKKCGGFHRIWSVGYCKKCFFQLNPPKPIAKMSKKGIAKKAEKKVVLDEIHLWEKGLWDKMKLPRICKSCSCKVLGEFSPFYFDHLKEKSQFPQLAMKEWNVLFVCKDCHTKKNIGFPTDVHKDYIKQAEIMYNTLKEIEMSKKDKNEDIPEDVKKEMEEEFGSFVKEEELELKNLNIKEFNEEEDELEQFPKDREKWVEGMLDDEEEDETWL